MVYKDGLECDKRYTIYLLQTKEANRYKVPYESDTWTNISYIQGKKAVEDDISPDEKIDDNEMTCARWWCVRRQRKVYYTTMCTMTDETACNNVHDDNVQDDG